MTPIAPKLWPLMAVSALALLSACASSTPRYLTKDQAVTVDVPVTIRPPAALIADCGTGIDHLPTTGNLTVAEVITWAAELSSVISDDCNARFKALRAFFSVLPSASSASPQAH